MKRRRLSWTEKRRARMALKIDAIEILERKQTITEPISVLGLSAGMAAGLSFLSPTQPDRFHPGTRERTDPGRSSRRAPAGATGQLGGVLPFAVHPRSAASTDRTLAHTHNVAPRKVSSDSWLSATSRQRHTPGDSAEGSLLNSRLKPAPRSTGGVAQPSNRGGAPASPAVRGVVTPLRFPRIDDQTTPISGILGATTLAGAGSSGVLAGAPRTLPVHLVNGRAPASTPASNQPNTASRLRIFGAASGGIPVDTIPNTTPLAPFTHFPLYVLDYNYGSILFPGFEQYAVIGGANQGWVDLRAQVRDTTVSTYSWDTTNLTQATNISPTNTYRLTFKWGTTNTAQTNSVTLTVTDNQGQQEIQTLSFWVPTGVSQVSGGAPTVTWPGSLPPDTIVPGAPETESQYVAVESNTGALQTSVALPTYNPVLPANNLAA
jgi:hypothetical protein